MPSDEQMRGWARDAGAVVIAFKQPGDDCAGWVSWWLRCRLKGKDFFAGKKFTLQDLRAIPKAGEGGLPALTKANTLQRNYEANGTATTRYVTGDRKKGGGQVALGTSSGEWSSFRQISGSAGAATAELNDEDAIFEAAAAAMKATADDAANILTSFRRTASYEVAALYSLSTNGRHAVGLDAQKSKPVYFDPNLGQCEFPSIGSLCAWWQKCFAARKETTGSAFGNIGENFKVVSYAAVH